MAQTVVIDIAARLQDQTSAGVQKVKENVDRLGKSIEKMKKQMSKMRKSEVALNVKDKATQAIEKISKTVSSLGRKTWNVSVRVLDKATAPLKGILNMLKNPILQAGTVLGISLGGANTFQTYQGFEKGMSNVKALSGANASDTAELTKLAREMGKTTTKSASEAADALGYMALAGWNKDQMKEAIQPVLRLSEAGNLDLGRTSDLVTDSMSSLGIGTGDLKGYLDKVAKTASSSNTNIDAMMEAFLEFGGTVKNNGIAHDEASALIGILANRGVKGSEAGTALNSVFVNLTTGAGQAGKAMEKLNLSAYDSQGNFKGYANTLKELYDKTKDLDDKQKAYYYSAIGGKTRLSDLQHLLSGVSGEYDELKEKIANSNGALEEMANIMNDNIYGDVKALQSAVESVQLDFMDKFQPSARKFLQWSKDLTLSFGQKLTRAAEKFQYRVEKIESTIKEFKSSKEWQNADLSGKISIAWDKIIAEPFAAWWSSEGKTWACGVANDIGYGISSALTAGISALLGIDLGEAADSGFDIGKSFAEGFINGFDGSKIWEGIKEKSKELVVNASKILPGGEQATGGSWLSAGLLAYGSMKAGKALGAGKLLGKLGGGVAENVTSIARTTKPITQNADDYVDFWRNAKLWNTTTREAAIESYQTSWRAINSSAVKKSLGGISSIFDDIAAKIAPYVPKLKGSIGKAGKFLKGNGLSLLFSAAAVMQAENKKKEMVVQGGSFATSLASGSLGTKAGAAVGTAIAPGVGTAIGGAIGGTVGSIGGYIGGEKLFKWITEQKGVIKQFFADTWIPVKEEAKKTSQWVNEKWDIAKSKLESIWSNVSDWFNNKIWTPIKDLAISTINVLVGFWEIGKQGIVKTWNTMTNWFYDTIWSPIKENVKEVTDKIIKVWDMTKGNLYNIWNSVSDWFINSVYNPIKEFANITVDWIGEKFNEAKSRITEIWSDVSGWFEGTVWSPIKNGVSSVKEWLEENFQVAKSFIISIWEGLSSWFQETVWNPIKNGATGVYNWVSEKFSAISSLFGKIGDIGSGKTGITTSAGNSTIFNNNSINIDKKAIGGIVNKPHFGVIGEAGAEAIIPLSGTNKHRGIALWQQTGELLGMLPKHAQGGIFGGSIDYKSMFDEAENKQQTTQSNSITINLGGMNFTFTGNATGDKESIIATIRQQMPEIANEVAETIAKELQKLLPNMKASIA